MLKCAQESPSEKEITHYAVNGGWIALNFLASNVFIC